jgi:23S rRNA pseudouridine955/2504/2580 synthase
MMIVAGNPSRIKYMPDIITSVPDDGAAGGVTFLVVEPGFEGQRIDNFLVARLKGVPKSVIYRCLRKGEVRVNKGRIKPDYRICEGDTIRIPPIRQAARVDSGPAIGDRVRTLLEQAILHEDDGLIVLNKPAGIAVHGGSGLSWGVIEALRAMRPDARHLELVHRIDRETSGCLLIAKKRSRLRSLHDQFQSGRIEKTYWAIVEGRWKKGVTSIEAPLHKFTDGSGERFVRVSESGKPSRTDFHIVQVFGSATWISAQPVTGRTHQIRVHCQFAGHPILGDEKYQSREALRLFRAEGASRMFLHARKVSFDDGAGRRVAIEAPLDEEMQNFLERWGRSSD